MAEKDSICGSSVSHYRVLEKLGEGGMGVVYKAEDTRLERYVALKLLPIAFADDPQMRDRFLREARAASALNHPNICTIYDVGEANGRIFIAMEFLDGLTVKESIASGPLETTKLVSIAGQILEGLEAAHHEGIIHRDIKLGNIIVTKSGRAKILDFGLAKKGTTGTVGVDDELSGRDRQQTSGLAALGTAAYMSPEQALGKPLDVRTDLFSFGIVLYEMATGKAPFRGDTTGVLLLSIVEETPQPPRQLNPNVPEGLQRIINKCLQKSCELRYQTATEIRKDLAALADSSACKPDRTEPQLSVLKSESPTSLAKTAEPVEPPPKHAAKSSTAIAWKSWKLRAGIAALAFLLILAPGLYLRSHHAHALQPQDSVVVADFTNTTSENVFDGSLRQATILDLDQSPFLNVLPDRRVRDVLKDMNRPANQRLTVEVAREICLRSNSQALIVGAISNESGGYHISLKALTCDTQKEIAADEADATPQSQVLPALSKADKQLRKKLGESLPSLAQYTRPLEECTTSSLEALQEYTEGVSALSHQGYEETIRHMKRAIQLDPNFAQAYTLLAGAYRGSDQYALAEQNYKQAFDLRSRTSERVQLRIATTYYYGITGQYPEAIEMCRKWIQAYPRDPAPYIFLGNALLALGKLEESTQAYVHAASLPPDQIATYVDKMAVYQSLDRYDEAKAAFSAARARNLDGESLRMNRYTIAQLEGDRSSMQEQLQWAQGRAGVEDRMLALQAAWEAYYGHCSRARQLESRAKEVAIRDKAQERVLQHQAELALLEAEVQNFSSARRSIKALVSEGASKQVMALIALAAANARENEQAEKLAVHLKTEHPLDTLILNFDVPTILAMVQINKNHAQEALTLLQPALSSELAAPYIGSLQTAYVRGLAYLKLKKGQQAAVEFQKVIDHPGLVDLSVIGSLAHLQLARAQALSGDRDSARRHYQDFLALWHDADPDLPILQQAKSEYSKLE